MVVHSSKVNPPLKKLPIFHKNMHSSVMFVCFLLMFWTGVGPITEYYCDKHKPVPVFLSAMAMKQTPPIDRPWCYHTGASLNGKPGWSPPISMHVLFWPPCCYPPLPGRIPWDGSSLEIARGYLCVPTPRLGHGRSGKLPIAPLIVLNRFRIIGTGETQNLPISYHSNPFLRKIIVKEKEGSETPIDGHVWINLCQYG